MEPLPSSGNIPPSQPSEVKQKKKKSPAQEVAGQSLSQTSDNTTGVSNKSLQGKVKTQDQDLTKKLDRANKAISKLRGFAQIHGGSIGLNTFELTPNDPIGKEIVAIMRNLQSFVSQAKVDPQGSLRCYKEASARLQTLKGPNSPIRDSRMRDDLSKIHLGTSTGTGPIKYDSFG